MTQFRSSAIWAGMTLPDNTTKELQEVSDELIGDTIGLCQAVDLLLQDLAQLSRHLDERNYEAAAQLGYESLASNFIFLQRCLGGLSKSCNDRNSIIQALARERRTSFEEEKPGAYAAMPAMQRKPST